MTRIPSLCHMAIKAEPLEKYSLPSGSNRSAHSGGTRSGVHSSGGIAPGAYRSIHAAYTSRNSEELCGMQPSRISAMRFGAMLYTCGPSSGTMP